MDKHNRWYYFKYILEHFMVWMRTAGQGKLKKLWGRIHQSLPAGVYYLIINNSILNIIILSI